MNNVEKTWCQNISRANVCWSVWGPGGSARWSLDKAHECTLGGPVCANGDEQNALQHCLWSGVLTLNHGETTARGFLVRHEANSNSDDDSKRDWVNNETGIGVARSMTAEDAYIYGTRGFIWGRCNHLAFTEQLTYNR